MGKRIKDWIMCHIFGRHNGHYFVENITSDAGLTITISWSQCEKCGKSRLNFIYGS